MESGRFKSCRDFFDEIVLCQPRQQPFRSLEVHDVSNGVSNVEVDERACCVAIEGVHDARDEFGTEHFLVEQSIVGLEQGIHRFEQLKAIETEWLLVRGQLAGWDDL